jgi:RNA polymerase sigma factor (sigma-70 family)
MKHAIQCLCRAALMGLTDSELLDALVVRRDEAAFEALLRRHGPMVLAVCRRVLRNAHDAEDAFQATFLVLIRKAAAIDKREAIGSWLYGVAYRTASKARVMNARRHIKELQAATRPGSQEAQQYPELDEELNALPVKYRVPVVLCELEGRSRKEVARLLNIPEGTLSSRLAKARKTLANRLRKRGLAFFGMCMASASSVPALLATATIEAAGQVLAGRGTAGFASAKVIALTEGVVRAMFVNKLKVFVAILVVLGGVGVGTSQVAHRAIAQGPAITTPDQSHDVADQVKLAAANVEAAQAALKMAEANLAMAKAQLAQKEAEYREARQRASGQSKKALPSALATGIAARFKYRVPIEIGWTENNEGGRIEILEVWGTQPEIKIGGQYVVRGKYTMPSHEQGTLYFHQTATVGSGISTELDLQYTKVEKGQGEFVLLHSMSEPGYFHLQLVGENKGRSSEVANMYFGTGDNVLRKKSW